jgi:hypothetical protein
VLGIASIVLCWCYGIISIIFGIIGLILGAKSITLFRESLGVYTHVSYGNAVAGKICSIIGLILGILFLAWIIIFVGAYKDQLLPHIQSIIEEGGYNF